MKTVTPLALALPAAILVVGAGLTLFGVERQQRAILTEAGQRFERETDRIAHEVGQRFDGPLQGLRGVSGLYAASDEVTRTDFEQFLSTGGLMREFSGVRGFGFIRRVPQAEVAGFVRAQRAHGAPDFAVRTLGAPTSSERYVIQYLWPLTANRPAIGLDIGSEPRRREAADRAAATGQPALTRPIVLAQDQQRTPGMLYLVPVYHHADARRPAANSMATLEGWAYVPIVAADLLKGVTPVDPGQAQAHFALSEGSADDLSSATVYDSGNLAAPEPASFQARRLLHIGGQDFRLDTTSSPTFEAGIDRTSPRLTAWTGGLLTLALSCLAWMLLTARRRIQAEAARMTRDLDRLAKVVERTSNAVIMTDLDLRITWVNDGFTRLYGHTLAEACGHTPGELLGTTESDPAEIDKLNAAAQQRRGCRVEVRNRTKDGRLLWIDTEVQPTLDAQGAAVGFIEIASDVTVQREGALQLATAMRETEALLSTIREHAIVSVSDPQGLIIDVNDALCQISGYRREELMGRNHSVLKSGRQPAPFWAAMWRTISSGQPWRGQICNRAKDGSLYWVDSIIAPFLNAQGRIERYVSIRTDITARKQVEQALHAQQQFLDRVGRLAGVGGWAVDLVTRQVTLTNEVRQLLDLTGATSPRALLRRMAVAQRPRLLEEVRRALRCGRGWDVEVAARGDAGTLRWLRVVGEVETDATGVPMRLYGAAQDVTRRRELEEGLRRGNELLTGVVENLPCGLAVFDAERHLLLHNEAFAQIAGITQAALARPGVRLDDIVRACADSQGLDLVRVEAYVQQSADEIRRATATHHEVVLNPHAIVDIRSAPMPGGGAVRTYVDVSDRKAREAEVRRADALLRAAIDTLDEAFVLYDPDDRLVFCNDKYRTLFATVGDLIVKGNSFETIVRGGVVRGQYPQAIGREEAWVAERLALHRRDQAEAVIKLDTGHWLRAVERRMPDGHVVGFRIDITDLVNASQTAQEALRVKSQFLANMSHEIRTPLNAILGMLTLLGRTSMTCRQSDYVVKCDRAARTLLALINDTLDFSKIEAGKMTLDPQWFPIDQLLADLWVLLSAQLGDGKPVNLRIERDPALPAMLQGDALRLLQVLANLGGNAIKFTAQGEVVVSVRAHPGDAQKLQVIFEVRDSGIGIAPEHQLRIFQGFSQAEASTTRRYGGTGLGLAISRHFVQMMGGDLQVDSQPGQGSHFHFQIAMPHAVDDGSFEATTTTRPPVPMPMLATPATDDSEADGPHVRAEPSRRLNGMQVLLVEDNANNRQVATELLADEGATVTQAVDGRAGAEAVLNGPHTFDAVLMDIQMPVMDGLEASRCIRGDSRFETLPIIAMSANVTPSDREASLAAGMNEHVGKPFDLNHLVRQLQRWTGWEAPDDDADDLPSLQLPQALAQQALAAGINLQGAMDRVMGKTDVYRRMVNGFSQQTQGTAALLQHCLAESRVDDARRELHSLKGLAAMLGADALSRLVAEGEAGVAHLDAAWTALLAERLAAGTATLQALAAQLPEGEPAPVTTGPHWPPLDASPVRALLDRLTTQLGNSDMDATRTLETLRSTCPHAPTVLLGPLEDAIQRLDFDAAQTHVRAMREQALT